MYVKLPPLSVLAHVADSKTDMYVHPSGHQLFVGLPDGEVGMFIVAEDLNVLSPEEVNLILQREILLAQ